MKIEIFNGNWTLGDVNSNPNKIFVFGDNNARVGKGGQAIIRDCVNAIGIRTKKGPSLKSVAFYSDDEFEKNKQNILEDVLSLKAKALETNSTIVFSSGGYGTGLASLKTKAPNTFQYLCQLLRDYFGFDNETGRRWIKVPGHDEIITGTYVCLDKSNTDVIQPINNSLFKSEHLASGLNSVFDLIKSENKTAFTSTSSYSPGEILLFSFYGRKEYLVCRVSDSVSIANSIISSNWLTFESFGESFDYMSYLESKTEPNYQTHFNFICSLSDKGEIIFKNDIFGDSKNDEKKAKVAGEPLVNKSEDDFQFDLDDPIVKDVPPFKEPDKEVKKESVDMDKNKDITNDDIYRMLLEIKDDLNSMKSKKWKNPFRKKTLDELLVISGIPGKVRAFNSPLSNDKYEVEFNGVFYYIKFYEGVFYNRIRFLLTTNKSMYDIMDF
jgi:hypothetical protein